MNVPGEAVLAGKVNLTGTGEAGSELEVLVDGKVVGQVAVGKDDKWSYEADLPKAGNYEVSVQTVDASGKVLAASKPVALTVTKPVIPPTLDTPGDS
ncbi:MAG: Ig-like domain-containing protein [Anaerolineae bacterium]